MKYTAYESEWKVETIIKLLLFREEKITVERIKSELTNIKKPTNLFKKIEIKTVDIKEYDKLLGIGGNE